MSAVYLATLFLSCLLLSALLCPVSRWIAVRVGAMDVPGPLGVHAEPTPRLGGLALALAFFGPVVAWTVANPGDSRLDEGMLWGVLVSGAFIWALGSREDIRSLSPTARLLGQAAVALLALFLGVRGEPLGLPWLGVALTFFYLVALPNAFNLLDGLNGLAASVALTAATFLLLLSLLQDSNTALSLSLALMGVSLGFLPFNFPRASTFMGDGGSLFLGFVLGGTAVILSAESRTLGELSAPALALVLPMGDAGLAILRRIRRGANPFMGDRFHLYDRLLFWGMGPVKTVATMALISAVAGISALVVFHLAWGWVLAVVLVEVLLLLALGWRIGSLTPQSL